MTPDQIDQHTAGNVALMKKATRLVRLNRTEEIFDLTDGSKERFFDFENNGGGDVIIEQRKNSHYLVGQVVGTKERGVLEDSRDLNVSLRLSRNKGVLGLPAGRVRGWKPEDNCMMPVVDWFAGLVQENGETAWRSLSLVNLNKIRQLRIHNRESNEDAIGTMWEVVLGYISVHVAQRIITAIDRGVAEDDVLLPKCAYSLDTESVMILESDRQKLRTGEDEESEICAPAKPKGKDYKKQLAFMSFGNGSSWSVILRFPIRAYKEDNQNVFMKLYKVDLDDGSKMLLERLSEFSVAVGAGVQDDLKDIKDTLWEMYSHPWSPPKALDIGSMMLVAGYEGNHTNMQTLAFQILGVIMNKRSSCADNRWAFGFMDLIGMDFGQALIWYALSDVLTGFNMAAVMFNWIFWAVYPDPALVFMNLDAIEDEKEWRSFFMITLAKLIGDRKADFNTLEKEPMTRKARILAVMGHTKNNPMTTGQIDAADWMHRLFPWTPHGIYGGPRFIEPVREHFARVLMPTLLKIFETEIKEERLMVKIDIKEVKSCEWRFKVMLGHERNHIVRDRAAYHTLLDARQPGTSASGFTYHPKLKQVVSTLSNAVTFKQAWQMKKSIERIREATFAETYAGDQTYDMYHALLEAGYHSPEQIPAIVYDIEEDYRLGKEAFKNGRAKAERKPEISKHQMLVKLYNILTTKKIGGSWWATIKAERQEKELNTQKKARRYDPNRETRVEVMEAARNAEKPRLGSVRGDRMAKVYERLPIDEWSAARNHRKRENRKRNRREERELGAEPEPVREVVERDYHMSDTNSEDGDTEVDESRVYYPPPTRDPEYYQRVNLRLSSPAREPEPRKKRRKNGRRSAPNDGVNMAEMEYYE